MRKDRLYINPALSASTKSQLISRIMSLLILIIFLFVPYVIWEGREVGMEGAGLSVTI